GAFEVRTTGRAPSSARSSSQSIASMRRSAAASTSRCRSGSANTKPSPPNAGVMMLSVTWTMSSCASKVRASSRPYSNAASDASLKSVATRMFFRRIMVASLHRRFWNHEFMFGTPDRQHRARREPHDALGDAADQQLRHGGPAVRAHHDQINAFSFRVVHDDVGRRIGHFDDWPRPEQGPVAV